LTKKEQKSSCKGKSETKGIVGKTKKKATSLLFLVGLVEKQKVGGTHVF